MTKMNPKHKNETKSKIFSGDTFKSDIIFHWSQIINSFNDFCNSHVSISLQKCAQRNKMK